MKIEKKTVTISAGKSPTGKGYEFEIDVPVYSSAEDIAKHMDEDEFVKILNYAIDIKARAKARADFIYNIVGEARALARLEKAKEDLERARKFKFREVKLKVVKKEDKDGMRNPIE